MRRPLPALDKVSYRLIETITMKILLPSFLSLHLLSALHRPHVQTDYAREPRRLQDERDNAVTTVPLAEI